MINAWFSIAIIFLLIVIVPQQSAALPPFLLGAPTSEQAGDPTDNPTPSSICHCAADFNQIDGVTVQDIFDFLSAWFSGDMAADINQDGQVGVQDIFDYLTLYFQGCENVPCAPTCD